MARPLRIEYPGAWYHVMNRGAARCAVFTADKDRRSFLELLGDIREMWKVEIHAYCLMGNHYHLLIHTPECNLSRAMRHVDGVYTQFYNKAHGRDGQLFRGRFKSIVVDRDEYLLELVRYIHFNPVKDGLARSPSQYPWSSHRQYLNLAKKPDWLEVDEVLSHFGKVRKRAAEELDRFVRAGVPGNIDERMNAQRLPSVLGSDVFRDWIRYNFVERLKGHKDIPEARRELRKVVSLKEVLRTVSNVFDVQPKEIAGRGSGRRNDARAAAVYLMRRHLGAGYREIGEAMGGMSDQAVAKAIARIRSKLENEEDLCERIEACCRDLSLVKT
ncbi:MAG: transposase [Proteobacteria bacterium]|nr:transposase [Pseudomonadota bacterium]